MSSRLLIPVGNKEMCLAAIHNGADEVYFGVPGFNARGRTIDFDLGEIKELIDLCHLYGVEANLAFNVVIFEEEIRELEPYVRELISLNPDALIIQDVGLMKLVKALCPDQNIHVSTQVTVTDSLAVEALKSLGVKRVTLSREMTLDEINDVRSKTDVELEVFVHGALCVAYSGQCLTSEIFGGRSANRGQCAQTCRLDFELVVDGETRDLDGKKYLLSPKDLCGVEEIPALQAMGITALKVEGRLKSPAYVASTTANYRAVIEQSQVPAKAKQEMELLFSRGFYSGWLHGVNHQELVDGLISSHQGSYLGDVKRIIGSKKIEITSRLVLKPGSGLSFIDFEQGERVGARVYGVEQSGANSYVLQFGNDFSAEVITKGWKVYQNDAPDLEKELQKSFTQTENLKVFSIDMVANVSIGKAVTVECQFDDGSCIVFTSSVVPEKAKSRGAEFSYIESELCKLGKSCYRVASFSGSVDEGVYLSQKQLRLIRNELIVFLDKERTVRPDRRLLSAEECYPKMIVQKQIQAPKLSVLIREQEQIPYLEDLPIDTVYLDFDYGRTYEHSMEAVRKMGYAVGIATLRVLKPFDMKYLDKIVELHPDVVLVRNLPALQYFKEHDIPVVTDYSFNICNSLAAEWILDQGIDRFTPGHDLNFQQLSRMMQYSSGEHVEILLHHYMPTFYMEHCPYAAFMSQGKDVRTCGKPCRKHKASLRDHKGVVHPVKPDYACRNTMYHGIPQSSARLIDDFKRMGIGQYRIEMLYETSDEIRNKVKTYADALNGSISSSAVYDTLQVIEKYGVSEGQMLSSSVYKNRKKER